MSTKLPTLTEQLRTVLAQEGFEDARRPSADLRRYLNEASSKFNKLVRTLRKNPRVRDPEALAAWIGLRLGRLKRKG